MSARGMDEREYSDDERHDEDADEHAIVSMDQVQKIIIFLMSRLISCEDFHNEFRFGSFGLMTRHIFDSIFNGFA